MRKWTLSAALPLIATALSVGCAPSSPQHTTPSIDVGQVMPVTIVEQVQGDDATLAEPTVILVKTQEQLEALGVASLTGLEVDLGANDLVVLALGEQPTGGYWARITGIQQVDNQLYVQGLANAPAEDEVVTQAVTYPFAVAVIPETDAAFALSDIESVRGQQPAEAVAVPEGVEADQAE